MRRSPPIRLNRPSSRGGTRPALAAWGLAGMLLALGLPAGLTARQPAGIHWRRIGAGDLAVVYPAAYAATARRLLEYAAPLLPRLENFWHVRVQGRVTILLDDSSDRSGSSSSCLPFNRIEIRLAEPPVESGSSRSSPELALTRELNRLCLMHAVRPGIRNLRSLFGFNFLTFPIAALPGWILDGLTIYGESSFGERGRMNTPDLELTLAALAEKNPIPSLRRLSGQISFWPGPGYRPLFGGTFFGFLSQRSGHSALLAYLRGQSSLITFISSGKAYPEAFGKDQQGLWREFTASHPPAPQAGSAWTPVTKTGFFKDYPQEIAPGLIAYARSDYRRRGAVEAVEASTGRIRSLFRLSDINGMSLDPDGRRLRLSALDIVSGWRESSDLFEFDLASRHLRRLTRGRQLSMPVADPGGNGCLCVLREGDNARLVRYDEQTRAVLPLTPLYPGLANPAPAPDGGLLAASLKLPDRNWAVALFSREGTLLKVIAPPGEEKWSQPAWNGGDLYFVAEIRGRYRLARFRNAEGMVEMATDDGWPPLRHFSFSRDGKTVLFTAVTDRGYEIGRRALADFSWAATPARLEDPAPAIVSLASPATDRPYRPWRDLLPHGWTPSLRQVEGEFQAGATVGGRDAPGVHTYRIGAYWGIRSREPNWFVQYTYNGFHPVLELNAERRSSLGSDRRNGDFERIDNRLRLTASWPLLVRNRVQLKLRADLHDDRIRESLPAGSATALDLRGVRLGLHLHGAQKYYDGLSLADGARLSLVWQQDWRALGSTADLTTVMAEYRHYLSLSRPNLLAWRLALADSWGGARQTFRLGGNGSEESEHNGDDPLFGLLRGFPSGYFSGSGGWLMNLEYRLQLVKVQRSLALSLNLNRLYLSVFADAGNLWNGRRTIHPAWSYGAELNTVIYFRGIRFVLATGLAAARQPDRSARFYLRFGTGSSF